MAKKKITRKELLNEQDEFITFSGKLIQFIAAHKAKILIGTGALVALVLVFSGISYFSSRAEASAFLLLEKGIARYERIHQAEGAQKAYQEVGGDFKTLLDKYPRKEGGKLARVVYGNMAYRAGDFETAIHNYERALGDFPERPFFRQLILSSLGYAHEGKKDLQKAVGYFEQVASSSEAARRDEALFNLGRIHGELGNLEKSREAYGKILSDHGGSIYTEIAREKMTG
jgi:tetratricopeptide (TPR) repeat protein